MKKVLRSDIKKVLEGFSGKYDEGYTNDEIEVLLGMFPSINKDKFNGVLMGNTCPIVNNEILTYPWDLESALICGIEGRDMTEEEFD